MNQNHITMEKKNSNSTVLKFYPFKNLDYLKIIKLFGKFEIKQNFK